MSLGGLSGLASGVDTSGIVDQLIDLERQANARLGRRKVAVQARQTGLKDIATKLAALKTATQELDSVSTWAPKQTRRVVRSHARGRHAARRRRHRRHHDRCRPARLLRPARLRLDAERAGGHARLYYDDDDQSSKVTVDVKENATAADVAAAINAKGAAPVFASVIADPLSGEERLVLSARKTGRDSGFVVNAAGLQASQLSEDGTYERSGQALDAAYRVNGSATTLYSQTNTVDNAVPGVRLELKGVTAAPASVTVGAPAVDHEVVKTKVKAFVDAYNAVVTTTRGKLSEKSVADATTSTDAAKGQLFGDTGLLSMLSSLRTRMGERLLGDVNDLADIGIAVPKATGATTPGRQGRQARDRRRQAQRRAHRGPEQGPRPVRPASAPASSLHQDADRHAPACSTARQVRRGRDQADRRPGHRAEDAPRGQGEAPQGPVRGHGVGAAQLAVAGRLAVGPAQPRSALSPPQARPRGPTTGEPSVRPRGALPAYTANPSAAYRQQSVLTASPGQLVVMLYDGALRFLLQASTAHARRRPRSPCDAKLRRAEAIIDELHSSLDKERGGEIASRLEGIYVFCKRHLIEARIERDAGDDRQGLRAPGRAPRGLGRRSPPDARRLAGPARARRARARAGGRGPLGGAGRGRRRAHPAGRGAARPPRPRRAPLLERLAEVQDRA